MTKTNPNVTDPAIVRLPKIHPIADWVTFLAVGKTSDYNAGPINGILRPDNVDDSMTLKAKIVEIGPDSLVPEDATHIHVRRGDLKDVMMLSVTDSYGAARDAAIIGWEREGELVLL